MRLVDEPDETESDALRRGGLPRRTAVVTGLCAAARGPEDDVRLTDARDRLQVAEGRRRCQCAPARSRGRRRIDPLGLVTEVDVVAARGDDARGRGRGEHCARDVPAVDPRRARVTTLLPNL